MIDACREAVKLDLRKIYPEGFLADFSRNEMRNVTLLSRGEEDWTWPVGFPGVVTVIYFGTISTHASFQVDLVLVAMGVSMSIIMMNILIGVLAESYNRGHLETVHNLSRRQSFDCSWCPVSSLCVYTLRMGAPRAAIPSGAFSPGIASFYHIHWLGEMPMCLC